MTWLVYLCRKGCFKHRKRASIVIKHTHTHTPRKHGHQHGIYTMRPFKPRLQKEMDLKILCMEKMGLDTVQRQMRMRFYWLVSSETQDHFSVAFTVLEVSTLVQLLTQIRLLVIHEKRVTF